MRVLVTGAEGMLGSQVLRDAPEGVEIIGTDVGDADLTDAASVGALFDRELHGVIHTAAFTAVDLAEEEEAKATAVNATATGLVAKACARAGIPLVMLSTDFVFDGTSTRPYREDDPTGPISAYGRSKLAGELAAENAHPDGTRIVRTQWLYGPRGRHFPGRMLELAAERDELTVVDDQNGCPTSTLELAPALWDVLRDAPAGRYHAVCEGSCTWFELAQAVFAERGIRGVDLRPCSTAEFPRPAPRPAYSVLDGSRLARLRGRTLAPWRDALRAYLEQESR